MLTPTPMSPTERQAVFSLAALYSFRMMGLFMVLPLLTLYADDLHGSTPFLIGLALGVYGLMQALLQVPLGLLSDRLGRKPVIAGGLFLFAVGSLVAAGGDSIWGVLLGRTMQGMGAIAGTLMALVADLTREEQRTKAMAVVGMSIGMSFMVALVIGPLVASWGGLASVFEFTAVLAVGGILLLWLWVPAGNKPVAIPQQGLGSLRQSLSSGYLLRLNLGVFLLHFLLMASFLLVPEMLELELGLARQGHWQVYLGVMVLSLVGMVPLMIVAERGAKPRAMFMLAIALLIPALSLLMAGGTMLYLALWLFFVAFNYLEASMPSLVSKTADEHRRGAAMGAFSTSQFLGAFFGGAVGGWMLQVSGSSALLALAGALVLLWLVAARGMWFPSAVGRKSVQGPI